jgi:pSer/pThr/pTyr-binding forkhead associated (FHA) protein
MLVLEILNSPDPNVLKTFRFFQKDIRFGRSRTCHLPLADSSLSSVHFILKSNESGLIGQNVESTYFHKNGKRISGQIGLAPGDTISIGDTTFRINEYTPEEKRTSNQDAYMDAIDRDPGLEGILIAIEKRLLNFSVRNDDEV